MIFTDVQTGILVAPIPINEHNVLMTTVRSITPLYRVLCSSFK